LKKRFFKNPYTERNRIKNLKAEADSLRKEYLITNKASLSIKADSINNAVINDLKEWRSNYPVAAKVERVKNLSIAAGIIQITAGVIGITTCIIQANGKTNFSYKIPQYNSSLKVIGEETIHSSFDNEWTIGHTMITILSAGLAVSGILTINF
jgi:hypothetical protein